MTEDNAHALYSPSSTYRNLCCVGALAVTVKAKELGLVKSSSYADWGTICHDYAKDALTAAHAMQHYNYDLIIDEEKRELVRNYAAFIGEINRNFRKTHDGVQHYIEYRVKWDDTYWGTADYILTGFHKKTKEFEVIFVDLKTGMGVEVTAEDNEQLLSYIICLSKTLGRKFDKMHCFIYQPRTPGKEFTRWTIDQPTLDKFALQILSNKEDCINHLAAVKAGKKKVGDDCAAGEWCRFCPGKEFHEGKPLCQSYAAHVNESSLKILDKVPEVPAIDTLSMEQKLEIFKRRKVIKEVLDKACKDILQYALKEKIEGYKVVEGTRKRGWKKDSIDAIAEVLKGMGVENPTKTSLIGIGEVEKVVGKGKLDDFTVLSAPSYQLVPEDDKRSEIKQIGLDDIGEIEFSE